MLFGVEASQLYPNLGVRQKIEDAGFTIIARNNSPKRATAILKQLRAGN